MTSGTTAPRARPRGLALPGVGQTGKRTIEPAVLDPADARQAAFEHVLPVEVRARAIGRVHGMNDERLAAPIEAVQLRHGAVECKEAVERQSRALAGSGQRDVAPEPRVVGIAHGRDGGQPVQTAAQHHDQQARIARAGESHLWHEAPQGQAGGPVPQKAPTAHDARFAAAHAYLLWNSGDMISSSSPCSRVSARATAWRVAWPMPSPSTSSATKRGIRAGVYAPGGDLCHAQTLAQSGGGSPRRVGVGPACRCRRPPQRLAELIGQAQHFLRLGLEREAAHDGHEEIVGRQHFGRLGLPGLRRLHERPGHGRQVSAGPEKRRLEALDEARGRIVRYEVPRELLSDVACRGSVRRQIAKHVHAGALPAVRVALAQHRPVAGFVARRGKEELAGFRRGIGKIADRPAGQNARQVGDIVLRVAAADAQRVQLQDFARQIFVQSPPAVEPGLAVGADRLRVVEIDQHGRMLLDGDQHVGETAQHVRADRLALVGAGHAAHGTLVGRDAKMIGPEHHEPFEEGSVRGRRHD